MNAPTQRPSRPLPVFTIGAALALWLAGAAGPAMAAPGDATTAPETSAATESRGAAARGPRARSDRGSRTASSDPDFNLLTVAPIAVPPVPRIGVPARVGEPPVLKLLEPLELPDVPVMADLPRPGPLRERVGNVPPPRPSGAPAESRVAGAVPPPPAVQNTAPAPAAPGPATAPATPEDLAGRAAAAALAMIEPEPPPAPGPSQAADPVPPATASAARDGEFQVAAGPSVPRIEIRPYSLRFDGPVADLSGAAEFGPTLEAVAAMMESNAELRVALVSYASGGSGLADVSLEARRTALRRALGLRMLLVERGIRQTRLDIRALGMSAPEGPADRIEILPLP